MVSQKVAMLRVSKTGISTNSASLRLDKHKAQGDLFAVASGTAQPAMQLQFGPTVRAMFLAMRPLPCVHRRAHTASPASSASHR
jgi:hypothetical protein